LRSSSASTRHSPGRRTGPASARRAPSGPARRRASSGTSAGGSGELAPGAERQRAALHGRAPLGGVPAHLSEEGEVEGAQRIAPEPLAGDLEAPDPYRDAPALRQVAALQRRRELPADHREGEAPAQGLGQVLEGGLLEVEAKRVAPAAPGEDAIRAGARG
jgi:hypothetical protein